MDKVELGRRLASARRSAGMTQESLASALGIDRTAVSRLEGGERRLDAAELVRAAEALDRPLAFFVEDEAPAVVSRRRDSDGSHPSTHELDLSLQRFAADVMTVAAMRLLPSAGEGGEQGTPVDHGAAEELAAGVRRQLLLASDPIADLGEVCQRLDLFVEVARLGAQGPDGACVEVDSPSGRYGVAVINGESQPGRRRMTLAHELGHWLSGDAYDAHGSSDDERMISSFAIHLLAPRSGVLARWHVQGDQPVRERAIDVAAAFMVSWSAALGHLKTLGLIDERDRQQLLDRPPRRGDFLHRGTWWREDLQPGYLSPAYVSACLRGYTARRLTASRTAELLRGAVSIEDLPAQEAPTSADLRRSFTGHAD